MQQMFTCPKCGSQNIIGESACRACGESFKYTCPQCGVSVDTKFKACSKCGATLYWPIHDQVKPSPTSKRKTYQEQEKISETGRPKPKKRSPTLIVALVIIAISVLVGLTLFIFSQRTPPTAPGASTSETELTPNATEVIEITAEELLQAYQTNKKTAEAEYKGKTLQVTGVISSSGKNVVGTYFVKLAGERVEAWLVQCMFDKEHEPELAQLTKGQRITVRGTCADFLPPDVTMKDCVLVD
jgi:transcription elongation factor Elf1